MPKRKVFQKYEFKLIENPEALKDFMACSMSKDCNSCGYRDGCLKRAIKRGWRE